MGADLFIFTLYVRAMNESQDAAAERIEQALSESQRLERDERNAELARQAEADQRVIEALAKPADG
jgi:hypothetical protein